MRNYIFVYGTLKRGYSNQDLLGNAIQLGEAEYIGEVITVDKYCMRKYPGSWFNYPYLYDKPIDNIKGELYLVDNDTLTKIDHYEGVPDLYYRKLIEVRNQHEEMFSAWVYCIKEIPEIIGDPLVEWTLEQE